VADLGGVTIRAARSAEHEAVGELCVAAYRAAGVAVASYEPRLRDVAGRAAGAGAEVLVAQDGGERLVGTVTFVLGGPMREIGTADEGEFRMLAVDPATGGRGIGTRLVEACAERARAAGRTGLVCSSQPSMVAAHAVYRKLGFVRDPARDWSPVPGVELVAFALVL
jgi:ribosomal protein S18 acetylase RimI-like enzyme